MRLPPSRGGNHTHVYVLCPRRSRAVPAGHREWIFGITKPHRNVEWWDGRSEIWGNSLSSRNALWTANATEKGLENAWCFLSSKSKTRARERRVCVVCVCVWGTEGGGPCGALLPVPPHHHHHHTHVLFPRCQNGCRTESPQLVSSVKRRWFCGSNAD